jgi:EAL domain-containing protein (putative c-di-GMP-specific phosphodiesterase class I)
MDRGFITAAFQPIVQLESRQVVGYEALMRGPAGTILSSPGQVFGPASGIPPEVIWDLDAACVAAAVRSGHLLIPSGLLFVNLHISTFLHLRTKQAYYQKLMESSGIPPEAVVIEISERATTQNPRALSRMIRTLRKMRFRFALDDFGTAYSGLHHLLWFEPEYIKIDRAFVMGIHRSARKQTIVSSAANLAAKLGSVVIAEGVEQEPEMRTLMELDIPMAQGFHFGRPAAAHAWARESPSSEAFKAWFTGPAPA